MGENDEMLHRQIVQGIVPPNYGTPEEQGNSIQKCTILQPTEEIEYSNRSRTARGNEYKKFDMEKLRDRKGTIVSSVDALADICR